MQEVFQFADYRRYISSHLGKTGRSGKKSKAAKAIGCHPAYLSRVLAEQADLSLEQAESLGTHLGHSLEEQEYFLLLVLHGRSGTPSLRQHFQKQIDEMKKKRLIIKDRIDKVESLTREDESQYYSSWIYAALHTLVSIPHLQSKQSLAEFLQIPLSRVNEVLEFLRLKGLVQEKQGKLNVGTTHLHLGNDSYNIAKHHMNWRTQTLTALERKSAEDLHYSAVVTLSEKDSHVVKDNLIRGLRENVDLITKSKEEKAYVYCFDFFSLREQS